MNKKSLPIDCPACAGRMHVAQLECPGCKTCVSGEFPLPQLAALTGDDREFALQFILASGSLKEMAKKYGVSYPTVRNRLDDVIAKLKDIRDDGETDPTAV